LEFEIPGTSNVEFKPSSLLANSFLIPHFSFRICQLRTQNSALRTSLLVTPVEHVLLVSVTIHEPRFTHKSSVSALAAEALMWVASK